MSKSFPGTGLGLRGVKAEDGPARRRVLVYGLAVMVSIALHYAAWRFWPPRDEPPKPIPRPQNAIEVLLTAPQAPARTSEPSQPEPSATLPKPPTDPAPRPKPPTPALPKPQAKPRPAPQFKPKPVPKPAPRRQPEPLPKPEPGEPKIPEKAERPIEKAPAAPAIPPAPPVDSPADAGPGEGKAKTSGAATARSDSPAEGGGRNADTFEAARADAAYLHNPKPEYPSMARSRHWEGKVVLRVKVLADGSCGEAEVVQSSGHDMLDEAASEAVRRWRFVPAKRGGKPIDSVVNIPLVFKLER
jgi:protein TonB